MKTLSIYAALLFSIFAINISFAQSSVKKETIKVWGNCGMCKKVIERSAKSAGASYASWNEDSKQLKVRYAVNKTSGTSIQKAIAKAGYDTQDLTADNAAYDKLPGCCQYERKGNAPEANAVSAKCCDNASCGKGADCCKDKTCCTAKSCCTKTAATAMKCCDNAKCGKEANACKGMTCCKDKTCCKS